MNNIRLDFSTRCVLFVVWMSSVIRKKNCFVKYLILYKPICFHLLKSVEIQFYLPRELLLLYGLQYYQAVCVIEKTNKMPINLRRTNIYTHFIWLKLTGQITCGIKIEIKRVKFKLEIGNGKTEWKKNHHIFLYSNIIN